MSVRVTPVWSSVVMRFFFSFSMLFCWSFSLVYKEKSYKLGVLFWCLYVDWDLVQKLSLKFKIVRLLYVVFVSKGAVSIRTEKEHYFFFVNVQNPRSSHGFNRNVLTGSFFVPKTAQSHLNTNIGPKVINT